MRSSNDSTVVGDKLLRLARMIAPATLNKRSTEADVDGMLRYFLASRRSVGNLSAAGELQKAAGLSLITGSRKYAVSSST